jgi:hypothetical protein
MPLENIKTIKEKRLDVVSKALAAFGEKITNNEDYEKYKILAEEEGQLQKDTLIEKMMATTKFNKLLKKGEMPIVNIPEMKFQNRSIKVELKYSSPQIKTIKN